ncbi:MAG TPA: imidazole glycerol phosphate synthase subunit HisH [Caulobacteraceae bacterium]|nr:imidazole glycerol phosphate synthase subunit HisH [Caulobacteraceae bacterium]
MRSVALVDYGSGNLPSALKALRRAAEAVGGAQVGATDDPEAIARADAVVLPGVGAFAACMDALRARPGVIEAMETAVRQRGVPFLGICVGLQLMADQGREFGLTPGLGWISGEVRRLEPANSAFKLPHMGWNSIERPKGPLFSGLATGDHMYFTHAYAIFPRVAGVAAGWTDHGGLFVSAVTSGNLSGVQFHPEKSQDAGARLLRNFLEWRP